MPIEREKIPWRELPHLRIEEAVAISGFSRSTVTKALKDEDLRSREIAGIRVIPMTEFRCWLHDDESEPSESPALSAIAEAKAAGLMRKIG